MSLWNALSKKITLKENEWERKDLLNTDLKDSGNDSESGLVTDEEEIDEAENKIKHLITLRN